MVHSCYQQQFKHWRPPSFCSSTAAGTNCSKQRRRGASFASSSAPLQLPVTRCLRTMPHNTLKYGLLPDLGMYVRGILQRRFYTEAIRKQWIKTASSHACGGGGSTSISCTPQNVAASSFLHEQTRSLWRFMHGPCANLLVESIPCMKKAKRSVALSVASSSHQKQQQQQHLPLSCGPPDAVEVSARFECAYGLTLPASMRQMLEA